MTLARRLSQPASVRGIRRLLLGRIGARALNKMLLGKRANLDDIEAYLLANKAPLRAPLVLISQVHRSGGTLLSQLLDGHAQIAAHPNELTIGFPTNEDWPPLRAALGADRCFRMMFNDKIACQMRNGYVKGTADSTPERHPIYLVPRLHYSLFKALFDAEPPNDTKEILDHFFASFFNAWLNYRGDLTEKRWIAGFAPRFANNAASVAGYFETYPEGRLIQIIRDPKTWYPSVQYRGRSDHRKMIPSQTLDVWLTSAKAIQRNKAAYGQRTIIIRFEDLVGRTEQTMMALAEALDIDYAPILTLPTFNGEVIRANSTFDVKAAGVIGAPLTRDKMLSAEERDLIDRQCMPTYEQILAASLLVPKEPCTGIHQNPIGI